MPPSPRLPAGSVVGARVRHAARVRGALLCAVALAALAACGAAQAALNIHRLEWRYIAPDPMAPPAPAPVPAPAPGGAGTPGNPVLAPEQTAPAERESVPEAAAGTVFTLPLRWPTDEGSPIRTVALRMQFPLADVPSETWAVLLSHFSEGGRVRVNGHPIGTIAAENAARHVAWRRPQLLAVDPTLLVAGNNTLEIETSFGAGAHTLAAVQVGLQSELWNTYSWEYFAETTWNWCGATLALLTAVVFGALWLQRREGYTHLLALAAVFWLLYSGAWLTEIVPANLRVWVQLAGMLGLAAFCATLAITLLRLSGIARARLEWAIWAYAAAGPAFLLGSSMRAGPYLHIMWQPGLVLILAAVTGVGLYRRSQGLTAPHALVLVAAIGTSIAGVIDFAASAGLAHVDGAPALNFAGPWMLAALATPLIDGLINLMHETETARVELESRVREREQLLKRNFERLRESERIKVEIQERQRIMQDMHDGLGSQLMSALMLVERGAVSNQQFAQILRESIDDMRLAIDALAAEDADLGAALGNLRFRMEPRLRAAGIELTWDARRLPEEIGLHPDVVLPILRIVQEALTNALKHSRAQAVRVTLGVETTPEGPVLDIRVSDNGRGIAEERVGGRGLLNMRNRAQKIGAQLRLESTPRVGTSVHLRARVAPEHPGRSTSQSVLNTQAVIERARQQN